MKEILSIEEQARATTRWIGSPSSIITHTILFVLCFVLAVLDILSFDRMLLALTTVVSLEAIYLAIFIQMTVNRQEEALSEVEHDIDEIQEDLDEIGEEMDEIIDDMDEWDEEDKVDEKRKNEQRQTLQNIHETIQKLATDIENLKK